MSTSSLRSSPRRLSAGCSPPLRRQAYRPRTRPRPSTSPRHRGAVTNYEDFTAVPAINYVSSGQATGYLDKVMFKDAITSRRPAAVPDRRPQPTPPR